MKVRVSLAILVAAFSFSCAEKAAVNTESPRKVITLPSTPEKRPYSPAIEAGNMLFVSGQIAIDPETGKLIEGDIEDQTRQVLENLKTIIQKGGYKMEQVVKCTVLLSDISFYAAVNKIYMEYFPADPPARMAFAVKDLPMGALIEIDAIAVK
jgi:2-iminobutanoate/2-iminopropanoate deaminase